MRCTQNFTIGFALSVLGSYGVCQAQVPQTTTVVDSRLGGGLLITHTDDPTQDFNSARQSFLDLDVAEAATSIRRGARRMQQTLAEVSDNSRQGVLESVAELESLARAVEQRSVGSVKRLDEAFARANYALAQRHYIAVLRDREQLTQARVREELRRSVEYLQRAGRQIGLQLQDDEAMVIDRARAFSSNLTAGLNASSDEVAFELRSLGQGLANVGERLGVRTAAGDPPIRR